jgi:hypothetical protein
VGRMKTVGISNVGLAAGGGGMGLAAGGGVDFFDRFGEF